MSKNFVILGAGMAGLLAAAILRDDVNTIVERQEALPNNHSALLRFRSSIVGDVVNVPFRPVRMVKGVAGSLGNPIADAVSYGIKTTGRATIRSIVSARGEIEERFIAPPDFIASLSRKVGPIDFGVDAGETIKTLGTGFPYISTLPMPELMKMLEWSGDLPKFESRQGATLSIKLENCDVYATLYFPDPKVPAYRASITGDRLIIEYAHIDRSFADHPIQHREAIAWACEQFGIPYGRWVGTPDYREMQYAKILPIPEDVRREFIIWASEVHRVYSLGRFATWRPNLLLDDLVNDIRVIARISGGNAYEYKK